MSKPNQTTPAAMSIDVEDWFQVQNLELTLHFGIRMNAGLFKMLIACLNSCQIIMFNLLVSSWVGYGNSLK